MTDPQYGRQDIYKVALQVNSYWFPNTYLTIAKYFADKGVSWDEVSPETVSGPDFSSAFGYRQILQQVQPFQHRAVAAAERKINNLRVFEEELK